GLWSAVLRPRVLVREAGLGGSLGEEAAGHGRRLSPLFLRGACTWVRGARRPATVRCALDTVLHAPQRPDRPIPGPAGAPQPLVGRCPRAAAAAGHPGGCPPGSSGGRDRLCPVAGGL